MTKRRKDETEVLSDVTSSTSTSHGISASTVTGDTEKIPLAPSSAEKKPVADEIAENAIYSYLRFLRARGMSIVRADEVARALSLPVSQVERIADRLRTRGVKVEY